MASYVEMSLDDIIQKNRTGNQRKMKKNQPLKKKNLKMIDARNKIISKKRTKITDAREKLVELAKQKDARLKLKQMREKRLAINKNKEGKINRGREMFLKALNRKGRGFAGPSRQITPQLLTNPTRNEQIAISQTVNNYNNRFAANQSFGSQSMVNNYLSNPIRRTIENDIEIIDDPMDIEYVPRKGLSSLMNRKASLQLKIIAHNDDFNGNKNVQGMMIDKELSPARPSSMLKKRLMALRNDKRGEITEKPILEYRIIVSNLRNSVTAGDIEELFGDVGEMQESRLVRPGTAEVIYKSLEDAQRAVDLYHNRQLDGQPMNCLLVTPRSSLGISRSGSKPGLYSTNSNVEPDISTFHKVLFSNL